jgi:hypothetical protein
MSVLQRSKNAVSLPKYSYQWITGNNGNIFYSGNVGINTRSDSQYNLDVSGTSNISGNIIIRGNLTTINDVSFNGNLVVGQNVNVKNNLYAENIEVTVITTTSDYRVKENPILLNETFFVDSLKPMFYKNKISNKEDMGFLAHEVQEIFPFLVNGEKDGKDFQSLNYNGFIALLVKEIQDLKKKFDYLKKEINDIKNEI